MQVAAKDIQLLGFALFMGFLGNIAATWVYQSLLEGHPENQWWTGITCLILLALIIIAFVYRKSPMKLD